MASIGKLCQEEKASLDQVFDQILFSYRCCPHTSTGEAPYTLIYNTDPPIPIQKLIKVVKLYKGESTLGKRIDQSRVSLSIAAKMLEKMRANHKRHFQNRRSTHTFKVGDVVLLKKHNVDKMQFYWEPNYRIIKLPSAWSAVAENQISGKSKRCSSEDWKLKPSSIARAARFVNNPQQVHDIDYTVDKSPAQAQVGTEAKHDDSVVKPSAQFQTGTNTKYNLPLGEIPFSARVFRKNINIFNNLRKSIKPPTKLDL